MKAWFLFRTLREKLLVLFFAAAAAVLWLTAATGRLVQGWQGWHSVSVEQENQRLWLEHRPAIEERAARAVKNIEPGRTLDASHLIGEVSALAGTAGLAVGIDPPRTQRTDQFAYHTVQVTVRRATLGALVGFYEALGRRAPYLALEQCTLAADRANPAQLNATFSIFSVEVDTAGHGPEPSGKQ
jgi:hypothetical protein